MADNPRPPDCDECGDAPAMSTAWFNGRTLTNLCAECYVWWQDHGLIENHDPKRRTR